MPGR
ncbi:hypothetical protein EI555_005929 [Monodon monoceros]|jgi:hypothetical protein